MIENMSSRSMQAKILTATVMIYLSLTNQGCHLEQNSLADVNSNKDLGAHFDASTIDSVMYDMADYSTAVLDWSLVNAKDDPLTGPRLDCLTAGVSTVRLMIGGYTSDYPCNSYRAESPHVQSGSYSIEIIALDEKGSPKASLVFQEKIAGRTDVGHITFLIPIP